MSGSYGLATAHGSDDASPHVRVAVAVECHRLDHDPSRAGASEAQLPKAAAAPMRINGLPSRLTKRRSLMRASRFGAGSPLGVPMRAVEPARDRHADGRPPPI
jgi:hypothetical protein